MISNIIISNQKFALIVDDVGFERNGERSIKKWCEEQGQSSCKILRDLEKQSLKNVHSYLIKEVESIEKNDSNNIILPPLSSLLLCVNAASVFQLINQIKKSPRIKQIFLWATTKNVSEHFVIPFLEYMADIVVNFVDFRHLTITARKSGGLVSKKVYTYQIVNDQFLVNISKTPHKREDIVLKPESLGTFKIDLDEEELIARNALKLPYERSSEKSPEGNIIYTPDADDDFDDEDPDEDLYI